MTASETIVQRYQRLRTAFGETINQVPPSRWAEPSPCAGWTARDVVGHVVETQGMFESLVGRSLQPGPNVAEDPLGAFLTATDQVRAHLEDPAQAQVEYDGVFGTMTFEDSVDGFLSFDLVIHRWDLARATGLDEHIEPDDVVWVQSRVAAFGDNLRRSGVCGPPVDVAADASAQDKLLGALGRVP